MNDFSLDDFIEDFLQEANEHLQSINQNLLLLERTLSAAGQLPETASSRVSIINELFRSFHTLKGLSGMVGLRPAEEISHLMESVLREIQTLSLEVNQLVIDQLFEGAKTLKVIVASITDSQEQVPDISNISNSLNQILKNKPAPISPSTISDDDENPQPTEPGSGEPLEEREKTEEDIEAVEEDIEAVIDRALSDHPDIKDSLGQDDLDKLSAAFQSGKLLYLVVFSPSSEKAGRGKNVSQLRHQLEEGGSIIKNIPLVQKDSVRFAFFVSRSKPVAVEVYQEAEVIPLKETIEEQIQTETTSDIKVETIKRAGLRDLSSHKISSNVRVDLERLEEILRIVGEMVIVRSRINDEMTKLGVQVNNGGRNPTFENLELSLGQLDRNLRDLRAAVTRARMVPLYEVFNHMPLAVRDLTRNQKKEVRLILEGEQTQIDKVMIDRLLDPLLHLVRNAITHGIETPSERTAAGKPAAGSLVIRGAWEGDQILIEIADDGRGIDTNQIQEKAEELGILNPGQTVDQSSLLEVIAKHGFSTLDKAHLGAGRGIGMEVVVQNIRSIGGTIELHSTPGKGTIFRLLMPLTLTILDAIIAQAGNERYAIPRHSVEEVIEIDPADVIKIESGELVTYRQSPLTLTRLSDLFKIPASKIGDRQFGIICCSREKQAALVVDHLLEMREVVVRAVQDPLVSTPGIFGATDLGDGRAVLILDVPALLFQAGR
jgi:two-component system, chemotaxis family, sensor kinase CheA